MFTTNCTGDIGIEVAGRVVAQAFIKPLMFSYAIHVYDLVQGGPHKAFASIAEGLIEMQAIAKREAAR